MTKKEFAVHVSFKSGIPLERATELIDDVFESLYHFSKKKGEDVETVIGTIKTLPITRNRFNTLHLDERPNNSIANPADLVVKSRRLQFHQD